MIDQLLGRPSPSLRRSQILVVLLFWVWRLYKGDGAHPPLPSRTRSAVAPRPSGRYVATLRKRTWLWRLWIGFAGRSRSTIGWMSKINERLKHFTPYQLILGTLTLVYALRHLDDLLGIGAPEPLSRMYSRSYYRATYVNTAFDAGFASAMAIRPKWLKDISSMAFTAYYLLFAREGDEVLRRFRALCTVEMLRVTWEKTNNPYIRMITYFHRPKILLIEHVSIPRPSTSSRSHLPPVKAMLFFDGTREQLAKCTQLVVDFPGGGFIAMGPECHEERLRHWAKRTGKPVLGVNYGKAPEYPYPWAIEEGFDAYRTLMESKGRTIGIKSGKLGVVLTGDSAGGNICATIMLRILEHPTGVPRPVSMILAYPALDFNFTSWMSPANLRVLRTEQSETHIPGIAHGKNHMRHKSPLSVVDDVGAKRRRQKSWGQAIGQKLPQLSKTPASSPVEEKRAFSPAAWTKSLPRNVSKVVGWLAEESGGDTTSDSENDNDDDADTVRGGDAVDWRREADKSLSERVKTPKTERFVEMPRVDSPQPVDGGAGPKRKKKAPIGTRLTMTSRVGYFQDRVITPSMMRAMAILYVGPKRNPDFETDYYISPILSPSNLLAHFPPVYLICGERDPFVDDTVIFGGRVREAKRQRRAEAELQMSKSAKFGEGLRMSTSKSDDAPDHIIRETDDDWVQMRIIEGWGHGFMQMSTLMREVDGVLSEMADWIDESFAKAAEVQRDSAEVRAAHAAAASSARPDDPILSPVEHLPPPRSTHVKPTAQYKPAARSHGGAADLDAPTQDVQDEHDGVIAFTPKARRKTTMPSSRFTPVARRPSKESLTLHRNNSAPKFDLDETGSSGEAFTLQTPPLGARSLPSPEAQRGSGVFALFGGRTPAGPSASSKPVPIHPSAFAPYGSIPPLSRRTSGGQGTSGEKKPHNPLLAAAAAGARAASPALAAAGLVPQSVSDVSQAELFRRRRLEAVYGMGDAEADHSEDETDDGEHED